MRVAADEMVGAPGVALGIADRIELVFGETTVHRTASALSAGCKGKDCGGSPAVQAWVDHEEFKP